MTIESLFVIPTTISNPAMVDDGHGNQVPDWDDTTDIDVMGWVAQQDRSEPQEFRDASVSDWLGYWPTGTPITQASRVTANGITYAVEGPPWSAVDPVGSDDHIEATLRQADG